jgi:hypothetical protein
MPLSALLVFHIAAGGIGLIAGWTALVARKGARLHRRSGTIFFIAMIAMSIAGAIVAVLAPAAPYLNLLVASVTVYLVVTSWATVLHKEKEIGLFERVALVVALAAGIAGITFGIEAMMSAKGTKDGIPAAAYLPFGIIGLLSAALDVSVIRRGGVAGAHRIARHLWRMCAALLIGSLAFFVGQGSKVFPAWFRETNLQVAPLIVVAALLTFWLIRVHFTRWYSHGRA